MNEQERHNLFSSLLARHQSELYAYVYAILRNWGDTDDVFQSACLALWRKFDVFQPGSSFLSWARQVMQFEVRRFLRQKRSPAYAAQELVDELDRTAVEVQGHRGERDLAALERCRQKLNVADAGLLELHYVQELGSREIADRLQRSQASVCHSLKRIRRWLFECIRLELAQEDHSGRKQG
jgi:RNA polymerase sigma-70 factor, ECF subfamily